MMIFDLLRDDDLRSSSKKQQRLILDGDNDDDCTYYNTVEEDRKARELLKTIGFDPENVNKVCAVYYDEEEDASRTVTPMIYFSRKGCIKMCDYLLSRGADCRKTTKLGILFPMYAAAVHGNVNVCDWLFRHGAKEDIRKQNLYGNSPLSIAMSHLSPISWLEVVPWLILNGALSPDGVIDDATMRKDLCPKSFWYCDNRPKLLSWAEDVVTTHSNVRLFLKGTCITSPSSSYETRNKKRKTSPSPLVTFNGKSGILELIADHVGNPKANDLRTVCQLIDLLPAFIEDTPFIPIDEDESDEEDY